MQKLIAWDVYRVMTEAVLRAYGSYGDDGNGMFRMPSPVDAKPLLIIASTGYGWEHVSVSHPRRTPNWTEMEFVKRRFFNPDETAMQLHVPASDHVNVHPNCLHLWRPMLVEIPRPPAIMVG